MHKFPNKLLVSIMILILCLSGLSVAYAADSPTTTNSEIGVQLNGSQIIFDKAVPKIINSRTMLPYRQVLETMGAKVTYDEQTKTVLAVKDNTELSFDIGKTDVLVKKDGKTTTKKMDVAPFIDPKTSRTFVPIRFLAESLDYSVTWDQNNKTAIIIDPLEIFGNADEDFSIISKIFTNEMDLEKAYEVTGTFQADVSAPLLPESDGFDFSISGSIEGIQHGTSIDMIMNMAINIDKLLANMPDDEKIFLEPMLEVLRDTKMDIKMDGKSGSMYMNTPIFSLADPSIDSNTWFEMNIFETYDQMGIDIRPLMDLNTQEETSISQMMQLALLGMNQGDVNSFNNMKIGYALLKNLIGDEAFSSYRSGSITTNSLKLNKNSIYSAIEKVLLQEDLGSVQIDALQIISALKELKLNSNIVIKTKNDKLYDYTMGYDVAFDDFYMRLDMSGDTLSSKVDMEFEHPLFTKMKLKSNSKYTETSKSPDLSLPKDAKVLDYNTYFMPQI